MAVVSFVDAGYETKVLEKDVQANTYAKELLGSIRTVHAFEMRERLVGWFLAECTTVYLGYGLAFWQGLRMLSTGEVTNSGDVITTLLPVVIAALSLTPSRALKH
ncbi:uncharacterized protein PgNI_12030 [Pyricularia grisea]|uniref:Uncharacterized protein n=1 Tax=Pyricularia grisea TaxID=148305 RepID=A0A6P8AQK5_PYRGI|nr:uncharacterized protein PgNI_12030 [Pyricularia grisea]TLD04326.1 hypothetical protein PgNI_12030 [Pyricularia grisea]